MHIERFDPATEPAKVKASYQLMSACKPVDDPYGPPISEPFFSAMIVLGWGEPQEMVLASDGSDEDCGGYVLELSQRENRDRGFLDAKVAPAHRRRGLGTKLLRHAADTARGDDRTLLYSYVRVGSAGEGFAEAMGGRPGLVHVRRVLDLDSIPAGRLAGLRSRAEQAAAGYSLLSWPGATPEEYVDQAAAVRNALADAPRQPGKEVRRVDREWIRAGEARSDKQGVHRYSVAARHDGTGELVGLTQVSTDPRVPDWGYQLITAVARPHRGHRLGLLIKVAMLDLLAGAEPGLRHILTGNAQRNEHMIAINSELGFRILDQWRVWELDVADVLA
jgi:RimJ/RimL family protein N-acetyltransferase/GNAT superfamily N-acetyltransferase